MADTPIDQWTTIPARLAAASDEMGTGVWWVSNPAMDLSRTKIFLLDEDFAVQPIHGRALTGLRQAQSAIAAALHLPHSAATNLDALADTLRDLDLWWPRTRRIALLWDHPEVLREADPSGFTELLDILAEAHDQLWQAGTEQGIVGDTHDRILHTVLVPGTSTATPLDPTDKAVQ